jgi:hypothetical protein
VPVPGRLPLDERHQVAELAQAGHGPALGGDAGFLDGGALELKVNTLVQNTAADCAEMPGKIALQAEGSQKEFRNIVLIPILKEPAKPATP